jgi:hypothetical protein
MRNATCEQARGLARPCSSRCSTTRASIGRDGEARSPALAGAACTGRARGSSKTTPLLTTDALEASCADRREREDVRLRLLGGGDCGRIGLRDGVGGGGRERQSGVERLETRGHPRLKIVLGIVALGAVALAARHEAQAAERRQLLIDRLARLLIHATVLAIAEAEYGEFEAGHLSVGALQPLEKRLGVVRRLAGAKVADHNDRWHRGVER